MLRLSVKRDRKRLRSPARSHRPEIVLNQKPVAVWFVDEIGEDLLQKLEFLPDPSFPLSHVAI